ncbi:MAG: hypothetical protein R3F43_08800 [bacterium]
MGVLDFLKRDSNSKINRLAKRFLNEHQQQQIRQEALEELVTYESPEAISALIRRLGVNSPRHHQERAGEALGIRAARQPVQAERHRAPGRLHQHRPDHLGGHPGPGAAGGAGSAWWGSCWRRSSSTPKDHRTIDARMQLIDAVADLQDHRIVPAVVPYAMDHDDDIRIKVHGPARSSGRPRPRRLRHRLRPALRGAHGLGGQRPRHPAGRPGAAHPEGGPVPAAPGSSPSSSRTGSPSTAPTSSRTEGHPAVIPTVIP